MKKIKIPWKLMFEIIRWFTNMFAFCFSSILAAYLLRMEITKLTADKQFIAIWGSIFLSFAIGIFSYRTIENNFWRKAYNILWPPYILEENVKP